MSETDSKSLMKDGLNSAAILRMGNSLQQILPGFNAKQFHKRALIGLDQLELKQRVQHLIGHLHSEFDLPFKKLSRYLQDLPQVWDFGSADDAKSIFAAWPVIDYVAVHGLENPRESLKTLEKITHLFTAEFAIRPFLQQHYDFTYAQLLDWCDHSSEHVRRLASEGSRPRLPWGIRLPNFIQDPSPLKPILTALSTDESLYVRRSVANSINDISKDNPKWAIKLCEELSKIQKEETDWIVKHALRSLVKSGDQAVLSLLGFSKNAEIEIQGFTISKPRIKMGESLEFSFELIGGKKQQQLVVDFVIYFMKANGKLAKKVFKLKNLSLSKSSPQTLQKSYSFKPITTRVYYPGLHQLAIQVNGKEIAKQDFHLLAN